MEQIDTLQITIAAQDLQTEILLFSNWKFGYFTLEDRTSNAINIIKS